MINRNLPFRHSLGGAIFSFQGWTCNNLFGGFFWGDTGLAASRGIICNYSYIKFQGVEGVERLLVTLRSTNAIGKVNTSQSYTLTASKAPEKWMGLEDDVSF